VVQVACKVDRIVQPEERVCSFAMYCGEAFRMWQCNMFLPSSHVSAAFCCIVFAVCVSCNPFHCFCQTAGCQQGLPSSFSKPWRLSLRQYVPARMHFGVLDSETHAEQHRLITAARSAVQLMYEPSCECPFMDPVRGSFPLIDHPPRRQRGPH
jgi:hypothetical protein